MVIVAIDPGETSGWCRINNTDDFVSAFAWGEFIGIDGWKENWGYICGGAKLLVMEEYRVYPSAALAHIGSTIPTVEVIGAIKLIAKTIGTPVALQGAGIAKSLWPNSRIKKYFPHLQPVSKAIAHEGNLIGRHATDALRHGLAYLEREHLWTPPLLEEDIL